MLIEPMTIEDGFIKRFFKNSLQLVLKDITSWVLYITLIFVVSVFINSIIGVFAETAPKHATAIVGVFTKIVFGLWLLFFGMELAANTDYATTNNFNILKQLSVTFKHARTFLFDNFMYIVVLISIIALLSAMVSSNPEVQKQAVTGGEFITFIYDNFILMNQLIFWGLIVASTSNKLFSFPVVRQFSLNGYEEAGMLSQKGFKVNPKLGLFKNITMPFALLAAPLLTFIIFLPLVMPFVSLFIYMAFREVFLNKKENEKQEVFAMEGKLQTVGLDK